LKCHVLSSLGRAINTMVNQQHVLIRSSSRPVVAAERTPHD
jgi:hypothetical protein